MSYRGLARLLALGVFWAIASPAAAEEEAPDRPGAGSASGRYRVSGETTDKATGLRREITGTISLEQQGDSYSASFELRTVLPGSQAAPAQVMGTGAGTVEGRTLRGTADTQILSSGVPGLDAGFVGMPRAVSARIRSKSLAEVAEDGSIEIEIDNEPAAGDRYRPTRTVLKGRRAADRGE